MRGPSITTAGVRATPRLAKAGRPWAAEVMSLTRQELVEYCDALMNPDAAVDVLLTCCLERWKRIPREIAEEV